MIMFPRFHVSCSQGSETWKRKQIKGFIMLIYEHDYTIVRKINFNIIQFMCDFVLKYLNIAQNCTYLFFVKFNLVVNYTFLFIKKLLKGYIMEVSEYCIGKESYPILFGGEFKAIREDAGITLKQFANFANRRSRTTAYNWECQTRMKSWQTLLLMEMVSAPIFILARKKWRNRNKQYVEQ